MTIAKTWMTAVLMIITKKILTFVRLIAKFMVARPYQDEKKDQHQISFP